MFGEPQKFVLFGGPSLQVGGAFQNKLCRYAYDGSGGPLPSYSRYRATFDVNVPAGQRLTAQPSSSILFETGRKITAFDSSPSNGFIVNGTLSNPVGLLELPANL